MTWLALFPGELVPTSKIASQTKVPSHYLSKILQQLAAAGLIRGRRGVRGGYTLSKQADDITLMEVVSAVSKTARTATRSRSKQELTRARCPLHRRIDDATAAAVRGLSDATLGEVIVEHRDDGRPFIFDGTVVQPRRD